MTQKKSPSTTRHQVSTKTHHKYNPEPADQNLDAADALPHALLLFKPSWKALMLNLMELLKLTLMPVTLLLIGMLLAYISRQHHDTQLAPIVSGISAVSLVGSVALLLATLPAYGLIQLKSARQEVVSFWEEFRMGLPMVWRFLGVNLIVTIVSVLCIAILFLPGFYAIRQFLAGHYIEGGLLLVCIMVALLPVMFPAQRIMLAQYYILDHEVSVRKALRWAADDARTYHKALWQMLGILMIMRAVSIINPVAAIIGLLLQTVYLFAPAVRYVEIQDHKRQKKSKK